MLRLRDAPSADELEGLAEDFADIVVRGAMEVIEATPREVVDDDHVGLARVAFWFDRRNWARLRMLIDRFNIAGVTNRRSRSPESRPTP